MKYKIIIFSLVVMIITGFVISKDTVFANEEEYIEVCNKIKENSVLYEELKYKPYLLGFDKELNTYILMVYSNDDTAKCVKIKGSYGYSKYSLGGYKEDNSRAFGQLYTYENEEWVTNGGSTNKQVDGNRSSYPDIIVSSFSIIYNKDNNILYEDVPTIFDITSGYNFSAWCKDANLNCQASSNENSNVIPYSYNDYWHIVRRTNTGKYLLTTIGNSVSIDNAEDYTFLFSEEYSKLKVWNLYSMDDVNGYKLNVRQYIYDTDGWKLQNYSTYDSRDTDDYIIDLGSGSGLDSTKILCYTNKDIYSENGLDLLVSASEKYGDILLEIPDKPINPEMPTETPEPTNVPVIDLTYLDTSLKLEDITINGFKYNGIEYKWGNIKNYIDSKDLEDYAVFYNDYNRQLVFVWAFDDLMVQGKLKKSGLRYFEYYFEFITSANNSSVTPYAIIKYQINTDGTLTEIDNILTETYSNNHQFEFAWTNAEYKPRLDDFTTFDNYITYVLNNNIVVSNCDIYDNAGVLLKSSISHDNSKIQIENIPDSEFGVLKHFLYEKLPIIGTVEVFIAKFKSVLNTMKETNKAPEIIMNVKDFYGYSGELNVLDLTWYEPYREYVKAIISALLIVPFILWVYRKGLPDAIGGI